MTAGLPVKRVAILLLMVLAGTAAAEEGGPRCEAVYSDADVVSFGYIFSARPGREITLPDFRLQVTGSPGVDRMLQLKRADGADHTVKLPERRAGAEPHEFEFEGRRYVVEVTRSVLENRTLDSDELVIWLRDEYQAARAVRQ